MFTYDGSSWRVASEPVYANTVTVGNSASRNIYIDSNSVDIRAGSTMLASFREEEIEFKSGASLNVHPGGMSMNQPAGGYQLSVAIQNNLDVGGDRAVTLSGDSVNVRRLSWDKKVYGNDEIMYRSDMICGSKIYKGLSNRTSVLIYTLDQIKSVMHTTYNGTDGYFCIAMNGDGNASSVHIDGVTWVGSELYAVFDRAFTGNMRVNFLIIAMRETTDRLVANLNQQVVS